MGPIVHLRGISVYGASVWAGEWTGVTRGDGAVVWVVGNAVAAAVVGVIVWVSVRCEYELCVWVVV